MKIHRHTGEACPGTPFSSRHPVFSRPTPGWRPGLRIE